MSSLSRTEAARRNGAKSKGPVTPEGKARSSRNALKHGLTAANVTLSYEDKDEYQQLLDGLRIELNPVGILENLALDEYVAALWAYHRALRLEPAYLDTMMDKVAGYANSKSRQGDPLAAIALAHEAAGITNLTRYQRHHSRNSDRALARLQDLQKRRLAQPKPAPAPEHNQTQQQNEPNVVPISQRIPRNEPNRQLSTQFNTFNTNLNFPDPEPIVPGRTEPRQP